MLEGALKGLPVDIWLVFGSFSYGFEGIVDGFQIGGLSVRAVSSGKGDLESITRFLATITSKPRGLLRTEARVFLDDNYPISLPVEAFPLCLFTDMVPVGVQDNSFRLLDLRGTTDRDQVNWHVLLTQMTEPSRMG